jgi:hypothetical protein
MTEWFPDVAVISPDRQVILDLIKLCKREMAYRSSVILTLQELGNTGHSDLAIQISEKVKEQEATAQLSVDVLFRRSESALVRGEEYLQILQDAVSKQL